MCDFMTDNHTDSGKIYLFLCIFIINKITCQDTGKNINAVIRRHIISIDRQCRHLRQIPVITINFLIQLRLQLIILKLIQPGNHINQCVILFKNQRGIIRHAVRI